MREGEKMIKMKWISAMSTRGKFHDYFIVKDNIVFQCNQAFTHKVSLLSNIKTNCKNCLKQRKELGLKWLMRFVMVENLIILQDKNVKVGLFMVMKYRVKQNS